MELSVVFQGPIDTKCATGGSIGVTEYCLRKTRASFPNAELILSTWSECPKLAELVDKVVVNKDPGSLLGSKSEKNFLANVNRQIVSTLGGLKAASGQYAAKLRTDTFLSNDQCLRVYIDQVKGQIKPCFFQQKILVSALGCGQMTIWPAPYHVSDVFQLGLRDDLIRYWNVRHCPAEYAEKYAKNKKRWWRGGEGDRPEMLAPEQYLFIGFLELNGYRPKMRSMLSANPSDYLFSEKIFAQHFLPFPNKLLGVELPERLARYEHTGHFSFRRDYASLNRVSRSR